MPRTVVVGLDGATWSLLRPWIDAGELPTLERILSEGLSSDLLSVLPPVTCPNWKAYATGKNPGKLGVFWWQNIDVANRRIHVPIERFHRHAEYWEYLAARERVGVLNVPTTYPPKRTGEFVVAGPPDGEDSGFAYPQSLEKRLRAEHDYRVAKRRLLKDGDPEAVEEVLDLIDLRFRVSKQLLDERELDFLQLTTVYIDSLHRHLWNDEVTLRGWKLIDSHLEAFVDDDYNLVLVSDHGHAKAETVFYVNEWLAARGYLTYDDDVAKRLHKLGVNADRIKQLLARADRTIPATDVRATVTKLTPQWVLNRVPNAQGELGGSKHGMVDWDRSDALASAQGPVYLTLARTHPRYDALRGELMDELAALTGPDGRPIARGVHRGEDIYAGPYLAEAPDIVIDKAPRVNIRETIGGERVFSRTDASWRGVNEREGLFAAIGPAFATGTVEDLSILDLAPTLLHMHGRAVPDDMDGAVRCDLFAPESEAATRDVEYRSALETISL
ncbi:alkaline phosphatase family protein [Haloferacaceae archaeon DSL9]